MKNEKDKALDDLFKSRLEDPVNEPGYREADWDALEQMLDEPRKRRGIVFWLPLISTAAAILLFLGWWLFRLNAKVDNQMVVKHNTHVNKNSIRGDEQHDRADSGRNSLLAGSSHQKSQQNKTAIDPADQIKKQTVNKVGKKPAEGLLANHTPAPTAGKTSYVRPFGSYGQISDGHGEAKTTSKNNGQDTRVLLAATGTNDTFDQGQNMILNAGDVVSTDIVGVPKFKMPDQKDDAKATNKLGFLKHPQFALSFIGASELNSVSSVAGSKSGSNVGLLFTAGLFNRLSITTGATYSSKPYYTDAADYHTAYTFKTSPSSILADCRVLDMPVNLDYMLYNAHRNKFSIGTGISSYIMLHESYQYFYDQPYAKGPSAYTVTHPGKYFFGIANIQATYERQINSKFGLSLQPYMKLPLTNIGYSQARLQTMGVAIGVNWHLNQQAKP